jgi:hypothetical protein
MKNACKEQAAALPYREREEIFQAQSKWAQDRILRVFGRVLRYSGNIFFENYSLFASAAFLSWLASGLPWFSNAFS